MNQRSALSRALIAGNVLSRLVKIVAAGVIGSHRVLRKLGEQRQRYGRFGVSARWARLRSSGRGARRRLAPHAVRRIHFNLPSAFPLNCLLSSSPCFSPTVQHCLFSSLS